MRSFKSSEHIRKKVDGPYFEVSAKKASSVPLCLLVPLTFGSGFQTHFILMKQTLTKSVWDLVLVFSHLPMESDDPFK